MITNQAFAQLQQLTAKQLSAMCHISEREAQVIKWRKNISLKLKSKLLKEAGYSFEPEKWVAPTEKKDYLNKIDKEQQIKMLDKGLESVKKSFLEGAITAQQFNRANKEYSKNVLLVNNQNL